MAMALGAIEIIALIVVLVTIIKLLVILVKPASWMKVVRPVYKTPALTMIVSLILAAVVLYYLLQGGITIVQIFAVMGLIALLAAITMSAYFKEVVAMADKMLKDKKIVKRAALSIIIWLVLAVWALYVLFA